MTESAQVVLSIRDLSVTLYRDGRGSLVLDRIGLEVRRGEIVALLGESGSGKSTLGLAVMGLLALDSAPEVEGSIAVDGVELAGAPPAAWRRMRRERLGVVFQDPIGSLNPTLTIGRQLEEAIGDGSDPAEWLARVGIPEPKSRLAAYPHQLSGGQCQRVMIAMAIAKRPGLILADEPTTALDVVVQAQILTLLRRLAREDGIAMLFVTHDLAVAASLADRVAVMQAGRLVEDGPVAALSAAPAHPYTAALLGARFDLAADRTRQLPTLATEAGGGKPGRDACGFAARCPLAEAACRSTRPPLVPARHGGSVACLRSSAVGPDLWQAAATPWPDAAPAASEILLELAQIEKIYTLPRRLPYGPIRRVHALNRVDLRIRRGESVAIVGGSGSGKSTLLRVAAGLLAPDRGDIVRAGTERPQVVFQDAAGSLTPWLTIGEQIGERLRPLKLGRAARAERVALALTQVGLDPSLAGARAAALSGGQCQRAALARAIVVPPSLLLCDEAVSAMDMTLAAAMLNLIGVLRRELGMALMFVTHDLAAARFVADRIIVMAEGRIVETGEGETLIRSPRHSATLNLLEAMPDRLARDAA
jgi:peptide/nickel transport system ATP-binding protein